MKRCVCVLVCALVLAMSSVARADGPNLRQSVTYFVNFINESLVQAATLTDLLQKEKKAPNYPYTAKYVFYSDLSRRIGNTLDMALNLCDLYHLYAKTTYCFTKDEKTYLFDRIDNILNVLQQLVDSPYPPIPDEATITTEDKAQMDQLRSTFAERVRKLRQLIRSSLPAFDR